ncbi:hypothetical protein BDV97DRAFT_358925 [Delphinella strobiligena]|nr:hypothetical protein BDV97DRAFT_358925 [Delphinella strobiligena]
MRRDLAVCRTALGAQATEARSSEQTASNGVKDEIKREGEISENLHDVDVDMTEESPKVPKESPSHGDSKSAAIASADAAQDQHLEQRPDQSQNDQQPQDPLQIDIPSGEHQGDNSTDAQTGTYSNFDFESLFNDPSAHPSPDIVQVPEQALEPAQPKPNALTAEPNLELKPDEPANSNNLAAGQSSVATQNKDTSKPAEVDAFDFGDLTKFGDNNDTNTHTTDNDNISSLLPGLESYANAPTSTNTPQQSTNQPTDDAFNIFDAAGAPSFGTNEPDNNNNNAQQGQDGDEGNPESEHKEQRDDTFDALMNFDNFDMGSFGAGDDADDGKAAFDASFFDIS